jgi:aspartyl-tRNA(Asn)/glutamyl-tRNA(Gln) amidotransferase subunit C
MSALTREEVAEIAQLARLALSEAELEAIGGDLRAFLEHVQALQEVDTTGIEPMTHAVPTILRLRTDKAEPSLDVEVALGDAPAQRDGCFEVPAIIKAAT